jgi:predicted MFS family arabinose efflux permease
MRTTQLRENDIVSVRVLLACAIAVLVISMGVRHTFGLFLPYVTSANGWGRETFAFAIGLQNLVWGMAQPITGAFGDRYGAHRVSLLGSVFYAIGLGGMALATTPLALSLTCGILIGIAHACTTYSIVFGVMGRRVPAERRSYLMGLLSAAGSFGQFAMVPFGQVAIDRLGWSNTLLAFCGLVLLIAPLSMGLFERPNATLKEHSSKRQTVQSAIWEALRHRSYLLLIIGYFVCGFQVVFIGVHLPAYLKDAHLPAHVIPISLAFIGLFNVFGSYGVGLLGSIIQQRYILSSIYFLRSIVIVAFLLIPISATSVYIFAALMGLLWLSTVPPTNSIIAKIFGVTHFSMLSGIAFCTHQIGSFLGVWLGGMLYDKVGNYNVMWIFIIALGFAAALIHLPINERQLQRDTLSPA